MRVLVDATALGSGLGGDETMLRGLLRGLARTAPPDVDVEVLCTPAADLPGEVGEQAGLRATRVRPLPGPAHFGARLPLTVRRRRGLDLVFSVTHGPVGGGAPTALMVQDLSFHHHPEFYPWASRQRLTTLVGHQARRSAAVLTVSEFSRRDLIDTYGLDPDRVHVVPNTVEPPADVAPTRLAAARGRLRRRGVEGEHLLYLGNLHPRKNVARAIEAFTRARQSGHLDGVRFVIAGARWWGAGEEEAAARAPAGSVIFLGRVDDDERRVLLGDARALVYVSRFEGFGLPPLEAMAVGTPVLASSTTAIPEVCGDAALLVDPLDTAAIAEAMGRLVHDQALRDRLVAAGHRRVGHHDVDSTGAAAWRAFAAACGSTEGARR